MESHQKYPEFKEYFKNINYVTFMLIHYKCNDYTQRTKLMDVIPMLYQAITQIKLISLGLSIDLMFER